MARGGEDERRGPPREDHDRRRGEQNPANLSRPAGFRGGAIAVIAVVVVVFLLGEDDLLGAVSLGGDDILGAAVAGAAVCGGSLLEGVGEGVLGGRRDPDRGTGDGGRGSTLHIGHGATGQSRRSMAELERSLIYQSINDGTSNQGAGLQPIALGAQGAVHNACSSIK